MPRYIVSGVDREDGGARFTTIQADSPDDAINKAGFVVEKVEPVTDQSAAPPIQGITARPPTYLAIAIFAAVGLAIGYGMAVVGCISAAFAFLSTDSDEGLRLGGGAIALYAISTGLSIALFGELLRAFRDIARNSFK